MPISPEPNYYRTRLSVADFRGWATRVMIAHGHDMRQNELNQPGTKSFTATCSRCGFECTPSLHPNRLDVTMGGRSWQHQAEVCRP